MAQVFGMEQTLKGATRADKAKVQLNGVTIGLAQNVEFNFTQQVSMLYEIGSNDVYYVGGRANGNCSLGRIVGPAGAAGDLAIGLGNICDTERPEVTLVAGSCEAGETRYRLSSCILTAIGVTITAADVIVNERLQLLFVNLDIS